MWAGCRDISVICAPVMTSLTLLAGPAVSPAGPSGPSPPAAPSSAPEPAPAPAAPVAASAATAAATADPKVLKLMALGFSKEECEAALRIADDNEEYAASVLFDQMS